MRILYEILTSAHWFHTHIHSNFHTFPGLENIYPFRIPYIPRFSSRSTKGSDYGVPLTGWWQWSRVCTWHTAVRQPALGRRPSWDSHPRDPGQTGSSRRAYRSGPCWPRSWRRPDRRHKTKNSKSDPELHLDERTKWKGTHKTLVPGDTTFRKTIKFRKMPWKYFPKSIPDTIYLTIEQSLSIHQDTHDVWHRLTDEMVFYVKVPATSHTALVPFSYQCHSQL